MSKNQLAAAIAMITLIAPDGATDLSIGANTYHVKNGEVDVPRDVAHHAYAFGYTNKPLNRDEIEAEAERTRQAQAEMDAANAADATAAGDDTQIEPGHIAAFLARDPDVVIADLSALNDADLAAAESAEVEGQGREAVADAITAERAARASK